jgi:hypothetical protein
MAQMTSRRTLLGAGVATAALALTQLGRAGIDAIDPGGGLALPKPPPRDAGGLRDTILVLDKQFWEAAGAHDVETLGRLVAAEYVGFTPDGTRWDRESVLEQHRRVRTANLQVTREREVIRVSEDAAILMYEAKYNIVTRAGEAAGGAHQRMVSCWTKRGGGWFVTFAHVTPII